MQQPIITLQNYTRNKDMLQKSFLSNFISPSLKTYHSPKNLKPSFIAAERVITVVQQNLFFRINSSSILNKINNIAVYSL